MYWPRLRLTPREAERWIPYFQPDKNQRAVVYRSYCGELNFNLINREDTENIQISRRSRVFAFTASGDVHNTEIQIFDSGGEQYTMGFTPITNMLLGLNADPRACGAWDPNVNFPFTGKMLSFGSVFGQMYSIAPHIFDPNIVLDPNQTLSVKGRNMFNLVSSVPEAIDPQSHVSFNFHVWEFPVE